MTNKWKHRYEHKPGRWIFAPTDEAREAGARIKAQVEALWKPPHFYFHLRPGGHVAAARRHLSRKFFFRVDIDDFFGRVSRSRITRCLKPWLSYALAREMASESVVKKPGVNTFGLPYGFVQSPILASLALDKSKLGSYLRRLDKGRDVDVSVYVDDIIVSADNENLLVELARQLKLMADASLFPLNESKCEGPSHEITAFNIKISRDMLEITRERMAGLLREYRAAASEHRKIGIYGYVESVNSDQAKELV